MSEKAKRVRVSWRDIRTMMGEEFGRDRTPLAVDTALRLMLKALNRGWDVVLDEQNLYGASWGVFVSYAQMNRHHVVWKTIKAAPEVCKQRCLAAGGSTAACMEIDRKWEVYEQWLK